MKNPLWLARKEAEVCPILLGKRLAETLSQLGEVTVNLARYPRAEALFQSLGNQRARHAEIWLQT